MPVNDNVTQSLVTNGAAVSTVMADLIACMYSQHSRKGMESNATRLGSSPQSCTWDGAGQAAGPAVHERTGTCCHTCTCLLLPSPGTFQSALKALVEVYKLGLRALRCFGLPASNKETVVPIDCN